MVRACLGRLCFRWGRFVEARPSFPPLRWSWFVSVGLRFFFSLAFSGFARSGPGVLVLVFSLGSSSPFCVPRLVSRLSNFHLILIFISSSSSFHPHFHFTVRASVAHPACLCVCVEHLNRCKVSTVAFCDSYCSHLAGGLPDL